MSPDRDEIVEQGHDTLADRVVPQWPLSKESFPTLQLHLIRTPRVSKNLTFRQLMTLLEKSPVPEVLLYQAEPHRLLFIICYSFAFVFTVYGIMFLDWALEESWLIYKENYDDLPTVHNLAFMLARGLSALAIFAVPTLIVVTALMFPTRLIRRLYFYPVTTTSKEPLIRFVVYPLIPRTSSPVITLPLSQLDRGKNWGKTKVWTADGLYGTASRSQFFVFLFEKGSRIPWIVDRQGWFWGDGRVWDVLFGKESVAEAEKGLSGDDYIRMEQERRKFIKAEKKKLLKAGKPLPPEMVEEDLDR
ncbi:uncharacterized protein V1516DRAFT_625391 [Lipomyces oligophaga]|uniref:uncharacterized protein n=1 Tax=Lipomyces oligophaga TaxID=45792 RepID=UPI0034CE1203